jgi:hypothetical protein
LHKDYLAFFSSYQTPGRGVSSSKISRKNIKKATMKLIIIFGFLWHTTSAFYFFSQSFTNASNDKNIWLQFISKEILTQNNLKKCVINLHLKNKNIVETKPILRYFNREHFR